IYAEAQAIAEASGDYDKTASIIWGWGSDDGDTHLVLSAERFERDLVQVENANFFDQAEFVGQVGAVPTNMRAATNGILPLPGWNEAFLNAQVSAQNVAEGGNPDSMNALTDPQCERLGFFVGSRSDDRGRRSGACLQDTSEWQYLTYGIERNSFAGSFSHAFSPRTEFYSFFQYSDSEIQHGDDGSNEARGPSLVLAPYDAVHLGMGLGNFAAEAGHAAPTAELANNPNTLANNGLNTAYWTQIRSGTPRVGAEDNETRTSTAGLQLGVRGDRSE